jgi:hypothetical protein
VQSQRPAGILQQTLIADVMFSQIMSFLVSVSAIVGIPMALLSYHAAQQQSRIDKTFEFYKDFNASGLDADAVLLISKWNEKFQEGAIKLRDPADHKSFEQQLQASLPQDPDIQAALLRVVPFYDRLGQCINAGLCDADTAYEILRERAHNIAGAYKSYLTDFQCYGSPFAKGVFVVDNLPPPTWWSFLRWWQRNPPDIAPPCKS